MSKKANKKRSLLDITLEEAVKVAKLGEGYSEGKEYLLKRKTNPLGEQFVQLCYKYNNSERVIANFSNTKNAVNVCEGNSYYRTIYRIVKYLEQRGFDLESASSED